jgi:hypothetical protein
VLLFRTEYLPRQDAWLGWMLLVLAVLGIVDRVRRARPRDGYDPRLVLLLAALLVAWCSVFAVLVPFTLVKIPSPLLLLGGILPGLDAVRALRYVWFEVVLIASFLAAYGVLFLTHARRPVHARLIAGALAVAALLEIFQPTISATSFPEHALEANPIGLDDEQRALYAQITDGAVLDLPLRYDLRGALFDMSYYAFLRGYHGRPAAACYNSFATPLQAEVAALAKRLPDPAAADALHAMGFRWIVVHDELVAQGELTKLAPLFADASRTALIARAHHRAIIFKPEEDPERTFEERLYRLTSPPAADDPSEAATPPSTAAR